MKEQHGLCAYCMRRIHNDSSTTIEHWVPLSQNKEQALQYSNFLGVCHGGRKSETDDNKILCGDASKEETAIRISPLRNHRKMVPFLTYICKIKTKNTLIISLSRNIINTKENKNEKSVFRKELDP